jgi:hypothetical protein
MDAMVDYGDAQTFSDPYITAKSAFFYISFVFQMQTSQGPGPHTSDPLF